MAGFDSFPNLHVEDKDFGHIWAELETGQPGEYALKDRFLFRGPHLCIPKCSLREKLIT